MKNQWLLARLEIMLLAEERGCWVSEGARKVRTEDAVALGD